MNVVVNRDEIRGVYREKKMKSTMEKMKRLFRENNVSEKDAVKDESEKMTSIYRQKLRRARWACSFNFPHIG